MGGTKKHIAGCNVEAWKKSFRLEGMSSVIFVAEPVTDQLIEDFINTVSHSLKAQGVPTMNLNTMAALVRDDVTTITVAIKNSSMEYTFLCTRDLAEQLKGYEKPHVVVHTSRGIGTGIVTEVHDEPVIDAEDGIAYDWAFQRVDQDELRRQRTVTSAIADRLKTRRKETRREQALAALGMTPDDVKALVHTVEKDEQS